MNLTNWLNQKRFKEHKTSVKEISGLLRVVERDLTDAQIPALSADRRFATAYNAALQLSTIVIHASGYSAASGHGHHWITFQVLPEFLGDQMASRINYFNLCRTKRNVTDYDRAGAISTSEAEELIKETRAFKEEVLNWLKENHPALLTQSL